MPIEWSRFLKLSEYRDYAYGMCAFEDKLFIVGMDEARGLGRMRYRIYVLSTDDGTKISEWGDDSSYSYAMLTSCSSIGGYLYVTGVTSKFWSAMVFDRYMRLVLRRDYIDPRVVPQTILSTERGPERIYVAGTELSRDKTTSIYIIELAKENLEVANSLPIKINGASCGCYSGEYNPATDEIVLGGYVKTDEGLEWLLVYIDKDLKSTRTYMPGIKGSIISITIDDEGYIYAVDGINMAKIDPAGRILTRTTIPSALSVKYMRDKTTERSSRVAVISGNEIILLNKDTLREFNRMYYIEEGASYIILSSTMTTVGNNIYIASTIAETFKRYGLYISKLSFR